MAKQLGEWEVFACFSADGTRVASKGTGHGKPAPTQKKARKAAKQPPETTKPRSKKPRLLEQRLAREEGARCKVADASGSSRDSTGADHSQALPGSTRCVPTPPGVGERAEDQETSEDVADDSSVLPVAAAEVVAMEVSQEEEETIANRQGASPSVAPGLVPGLHEAMPALATEERTAHRLADSLPRRSAALPPRRGATAPTR
uniref:Uncharacterized protein n=1 Tax=Sphaerodactylus townsendi TaxID=933632 RepID=A0ACB8GC24_9SAUR